MKTIRVTFADGNTLVTSINGSKDEIKSYYIGKCFQFGDTEETPTDKMIEAVKVDFLQPFKFSFVGRQSGAIGKTYKINETIEAFSEKDAFDKLYNKYEHISTLCLNGDLLSHR